jgi:hypothetical protein
LSKLSAIGDAIVKAFQPTISRHTNNSTMAKTIQATNLAALETTTEKAFYAAFKSSKSTTTPST